MSVVFSKGRPGGFVALSPRETARHQPLSRISVSIPEILLAALDRLVNRRGFPSRSHAVALVLGQFIVEHREAIGDEISLGTLTVLHTDLYDVHRQLAKVRHRWLELIVSSINVPLEDGHTLEVMVVRGPARSLKGIGDEVGRLRGVMFCRTQLVGTSNSGLHGVSAPQPRSEAALDIDRMAAAS